MLRSHWRIPPPAEEPAVSNVGSVATRNVAILPGASGSSASAIMPSWFGVHRPVAPSFGASSVIPPSLSGPHVRSARQNPDGQSMSSSHATASPPPHAPVMLQSNMKTTPRDRDMAARYDRDPTMSTPLLQRSKQSTCSAAL